jgi:hypothetical protein
MSAFGATKNDFVVTYTVAQSFRYDGRSVAKGEVLSKNDPVVAKVLKERRRRPTSASTAARRAGAVRTARPATAGGVGPTTTPTRTSSTLNVRRLAKQPGRPI